MIADVIQNNDLWYVGERHLYWRQKNGVSITYQPDSETDVSNKMLNDTGSERISYAGY